MCHYILLVLPGNADPVSLGTVFQSYGRRVHTIHNRYLQSQLSPGDFCVRATNSHCDCGTALGSLNHRQEVPGGNLDRAIERLREKGWAETKIRRWIAEKERTREKHQAELALRSQQKTFEAEKWLQFLTYVLESGATTKISLLLHWFNSSIVAEPLHILSSEQHSITQVDTELLMRIQEDVLYHFTGSR